MNYNLKILKEELKIIIELTELLTHLKACKFVIALVLAFKKIESQDKTKYDNYCSSWKAEVITIESDIDDVFQSIYSTVVINIGSGLIIDSGIDDTISISNIILYLEAVI